MLQAERLQYTLIDHSTCEHSVQFVIIIPCVRSPTGSCEPISAANSPNTRSRHELRAPSRTPLRSILSLFYRTAGPVSPPCHCFLCKLLVRDIPTVAPCSSNEMSLPGLGLTEQSAEAQYAPPPPTQISLSKGSEWRFEVAFGRTVRVKVCSLSPTSSYDILWLPYLLRVLV